MTKRQQIIGLIQNKVNTIVEDLANPMLTVDKDGKVVVSAPLNPADATQNANIVNQIKTNPQLKQQIAKNPKLAQQIMPQVPSGMISALMNPNQSSFTNSTTMESKVPKVKLEGIIKEWSEHNGQQFTTLYNDTLNFDEIQVFAGSINNIYRNAAQRWLQDLEHKKYAQNIVFILKQRGYLPETSTDEAIQDFQDLLEKKANSNLTALVYNNCFVVMFGFFVENSERKHFIQSETWYTVDGHLRAINLNQFESKKERTDTYKKAIGKVL